MAKPDKNLLPNTFTKLVVSREYRPEAGSMSSYDVLKKVTYTKNPDGTYSAVTDLGENMGKLSPKEAQAAYKYKVPMGIIAEPDTGPSKVSENKPASQKPIGAKADKAAKPAAAKQTKTNLAATNSASKTNSAPKVNSVGKASLAAFEKWGEALPEGDTKEAARALYRKAKAGEISQTDLQKLQGELQAQVDKRKAAAEAKSAPKETKPSSKTTPSEKAGAAKIKSVASNPAAKATADAVKAEAATAKATAARTLASTMEGAKKGFGKALNKVFGPAYVGYNVFGRGKEIYDDLGKGKTIGEALDKPESNKQVGEAILDTGLAMAGARAGARFGLPGAVIGSAALPLVGKLGLRAADVAIRGPKKQSETDQPSAQKEGRPAAPTRQYAYEEIESMAKQKGVPFEEAFRQIQEMQQEEIDRRAPVEEVRRAEPVDETFVPSGEESAALAKEAMRAPIGQEPDIMSFLQQPDTEQMLAELAAKQASRVQSASNGATPDTRKKRKSSSSFYEEEKTTNPANDRPLPRFYVNTGRFGTTMGAGSRRPLG